MTPSEGRIRALFVHGCLDQAILDGPEVVTAIEARLGPERLAHARSRMRLGWLDVNDLWDLGRGVREATDRAREEAYWQATLRVQLESGMLAPIRAAAFAIFGPTPLALARWTPKAWPQLFPDGPHAEFVEGEEGSATLRLKEWRWDEDVLQIFRTALHGVFSGFFAMTDRTGEVTSQLEEAGALFQLDWS